MKKTHRYLAISIFFVFSLQIFAVSPSIIPYPQKLIQKEGNFVFSKNTGYSENEPNSISAKTAIQFTSNFLKVTGINIKKNTESYKESVNFIRFCSNPDIVNEGYKLLVTPDSIIISASTESGFFYAIQTLYQLLPADIYSSKRSGIKKWTVPCVEIEDAPRFAYRGLHLDVCRHFFPVSFIKKYIDAMAIHKLNRFHWHLTDDQGWRIEIKKYPLLTQIGSYRNGTMKGYYYENFPQQFDNKRYGGFYTQEEAREIVAYAAERQITVIPEIEMPGHAVAALAAYPEFSCTRKNISVERKWGIFDDVFCPRDTTFAFLEDILTEVMDIFPSQYIHIGGDECPKTRWKTCPDCQKRINSLGLKDEHELQSYFIQRIEKFVNSKGRKIIGWDEILQGGLAPNATVMSWNGIEGGISAAQSGHDAIMTPENMCYFDKYQDDPATEPTTIGGMLRVSDVYGYEPVPATLTPDEAKHIIGAQANIWTEYILDSRHVEHMAFPRVSALSEVLWTLPENKNQLRFNQAMIKQYQRYKAEDIHASESFFSISAQVKTHENHKTLIELVSNVPNAKIYYTTDGSSPDIHSQFYNSPVEIDKKTTVRAQTYTGTKKIGKAFSKTYAANIASGLTYAKINQSSWLNGASEYALTDGIFGDVQSLQRWLAFYGADNHQLVLDLKSPVNFSQVNIGILYLPGMRGLITPEITIAVSDDGVHFDSIATYKPAIPADYMRRIIRPEIRFPGVKKQFIKITCKNSGQSEGVKGILENSLLFVDEIEVN